MLCFLGYHHAPGHDRAPIRARAGHPRACVATEARFDRLVAERRVEDAVALLAEPLELTAARKASLIDAACDSSSADTLPSAADGGDRDREQQERLEAVYAALAERGALRAFGSVAATGLLPLEARDVSPEDQLRLTGLATTAFAPPSGGSTGDILAGTGAALMFTFLADQFQIDGRVALAALGAVFAADRLLLRGAAAEAATRLVRPAYATTVREHEAGHFLCAYLLGCPIEACLLDPWAAAADGRFAGAAGTVFFDPELGRAMAAGTITREAIDRYSVVVMAGIAAEAAQNGRAEGGQSDERALVQLLGALGGGKAWGAERVRNQARWAASQAVLLLREHGAPYQALCEALERRESVGGCVLAIEAAIDDAFGRNGELPAQTRARQLATRAAAAATAEPSAAAVALAAAPAAAAAAAAGPGAGAGGGGGGGGGGVEPGGGDDGLDPVGDWLDERQRAIGERLKQIKERLAREDETWSEPEQ